jgi:hypothetical protein
MGAAIVRVLHDPAGAIGELKVQFTLSLLSGFDNFME